MIILSLFSILFTYFRWVVIPIHVANDLHFSFNESLVSQFTLPSTWGSLGAVGMGEYAVFVLWAWPINLIFGFFGNLGLSHATLLFLLVFLPFFLLGIWGINRLLSFSGIAGPGKLIATVFYLINSYILLIIDGGQLAISLAYAWMPVVFLAVIKSTASGWQGKLIAGLAVSILGFFDIRFIYILALLLLISFLYSLVFLDRREWQGFLFSWVYTSVVAGVVYLGLNMYWLLPAVMAKAPTLPETYNRASQLDFLGFAELKHTVSLLQPHWPENVFGRILPFKKEFILIPILAFIAPFLSRKKVVYFWTLIALVAVFLAKGANPPLPGVYLWLFRNIPGFSLFRDSTKFFFLTALSYSVLIGITTVEISRRFPKLKNIFAVLVIGYLVFLVRPVWLGQTTGTFSPPVYQGEFLALADKIQKDNAFGRLLWIPTKAPLGFASPTHPSVEASRLVGKRPFAIGTVGRYEAFNFLRESPIVSELIDVAAITHISYPYPDERRQLFEEEEVDYYYAFSSQIENLPWIKEKVFDFPINTFRTAKNQDHFFLAENTFYIVGSDRLYWEVVDIPGFELSNNAFVWAEEQPGLIIPKKARIILFEKDEIDLAASFSPKENFIFPAERLDFDPNEAGWWKRETPDLIWWRDFLQQNYGIDNLDFDYGGGWAVAEGNKQLTINSKQLTVGNILLARVMQSSKGGVVEFWQGEEKIGEINTKIDRPEKIEIELTGYGEIPNQVFEYDKADFGWFEIGELTEDRNLTIRTVGDINIVNSLISVPVGEWEVLKRKIQDLKREGNLIFWDQLTKQSEEKLFTSHNNATISYQNLSPTHYEIVVNGLENPTTLVFSETFDPLWQINSKENSFPVYGLLNGFSLEKNGEYDVYFSAQKYVFPGLIVSGVTIAVLIGFFLYNFASDKKTKRNKRN